ncbi:MAG: PDK repeat-containing protein [Bacteroidetes bacterium]|nr:MAG: PDK repeat-containing protein [Bacteroidota bacterium]
MNLRCKISLLFIIASFTGMSGALANCPNVNAAFTTSVINICGPGPVTVNFTNTSTGANAGAANYAWYLNSVLFANTAGLAAPPGSPISAAGTYTYMLIAADASVPCTDTAFVTVTIHPLPNASFTFSPNNQCAGTSVAFTNTSTGTTTGTTYQWNFGDAGTSALANPSHTYGAGGTYTVTLVVTNFPGCTSTFTTTVTALAIPAVSISGNDGDGDTQYCLLPGDPNTSEVVVFSNFTTGATSYTWDFGDGSPLYTTASNANIPHTYNVYGTFTVTMTATGPNGCTATATLTVIFERYVGASFSVPIVQMSGCLPLTVTPVNASQNATTYVWNFGDGSPPVTTTSPVPPTHIYTVAGTYTITLVASNSCNSSTSTVSPIVVVGAPIVNFFANPSPGCSPQVVTFTNASTGVSPANNYSWNFGNGNTLTGTGNPPPQTYLQGSYTITLIAGSACGTDTLTRVIIVDTIPDVNLTVNPTNGCTPLTVTSNNTSTGGALSYQWYIDNVYYSNAVNIPPQVFTAPPGNAIANHNIHLYVTNHCGTRDSLVNIQVHPAVQAVFAPLNSTICQGQSITFTQSSFGDSLTYAWDFGNGNTATTAGPHTQTYNTAGTFTVQLIVDGYCGTDTLTATVVVNPMPNAVITPNIVTGCEDLLVNFTNGSTVGGTYNWNFGLSATPTGSTAFTPPPVTFTTPGNQMVTLTVNLLGCISYDTVYINVLPEPVPGFTVVPPAGCSPLAVSFNNTTTADPGNSYTWDFGNGNTSSQQNPPGQNYLAAANDSVYTVELVVTNSSGCSDSVSIPVTVHPLPVASFTMSADTVCALDNIIFTNTSTGINVYSWNFGDLGTSTTTNPVHAYGSAGNYTVQLIATTAYGCADTATGLVVVDSIPTASFTASVECVGDSTVFVNATTGNISSWTWNFGDASSGTLQSPSHLYGTAGTYTVTLTATNLAGCSHFITQPVLVNIIPVAGFVSSTVCVGQSTAFTDQTTGTPINWTWDFGDGSPAGSTQNPSHVYGTAGTYTVTLISAAGSGCADTVATTVTVNPVPAAAFSFVSVCASDTVFFTDASLGNPTTFSWDFGDGNTDNTNNPNPSHVYPNSGSYNVTLTAGYATGCTNSIIIPVTIYPRTVPAFTSNIPCLGGATAFSDLTTNAPVSWQWNFGDGSPVNTSQNPSHVYGNAGTYPVTLVTQNTFGCIDSITTNVQVYPLPLADFAADTVCEGFFSAFTDSSLSAASWSWDFGDGSPLDITQNPSHTYLLQGTYNVTLIVTNPQGCPDTITQPVIVRPNPVSAFAGTIACHTYNTIYTDNSTSAVGWEWNFGDGSPVNNTQSPAYVFANPGTYTTSLVVFNIFGCTDTSTQQVTVLPQPQAGFVSATVCASQAVIFNDTTTGLPTNWQWDFGDGSPADLNQSPAHIYAVGGNYQVTLIAGNGAGCIDTLQTTITVNTVPVPAFTATSVCLGNITSFTDLSVDPTPLVNWFWDFGDGNNSLAANPNYIYQNPGTYTVTLTVTNASGCNDSITGTVTVTGVPVAAFSSDTVCVGSATTFTDLSTNSPNSWNWDFGDGNTSTTGPVTTHTYSSAGTYLVSLIVSGGSGCTDQVFQVVTVSNSVQAAMTVNSSVCANAPVTFTDNSVSVGGNISSWQWDFGDGSPLDSNQNTIHVYPVPGNYVITLTVSATSGCVSITTQNVTVNAVPISAFLSSMACANQQTNFTDASQGNITGWQWDFGDGNTSTQQHPSNQYASNGSYNVTLIVTTAAGCSDTIITPVPVYSQPVAAFSADTVCYGDSTSFLDLSTTTDGFITSWNWDFSDGNTSAQQNPVNAFALVNDSFLVTLVVQTTYGCTDTITQLVVTYPIPDLNFGPVAASGCEDFTAQFYDSSLVNGGNVINWLWDFGDGNFSYAQNPVHTYNDPGSFYVSLTVTTTYGCVLSDSLNYPVVVYPKPVAQFDPVPNTVSILQPEISFIDLSQGASYWQWDFDDAEGSILQNPSHVYGDTGHFDVTQVVINSYGCSDTVTHPVTVEAEFTYFIPNAFTPNSDGENDVFFGKGIGIRTFEMLIFDRWGNMIFKSTDPAKGWDGKLASGTKAEIDAYVYRVYIIDVLDEEHRYMGHVSLIR